MAATAPLLFDAYYEPTAEMLVSEWADANRVLVSRAAAEPGKYRTSRTPYLRDIMNDLSASRTEVRTVVFKKAAQIGATEAGSNWLGYIIDQAPGPVMLVQPNLELAKRYSRQRIDTLIEACPPLRRKVASAKSRDSGNTMTSKEFDGGILIITGANSAASLRSMPVRFLFLDEVDGYPPDIEGEGSPMKLAEARLQTFGLRAKEFICSTPTLKGTSVVSARYEASDMRRYYVPCPLCDTPQPLEFERLKWTPGDCGSVRYHCVACNGSFPEYHKSAMLAAGAWKATRESNDASVRGYHLSGLYSPIGWLSWQDIAQQFEDSAGDADARKTFVNTVLGEAYEETQGDVPAWERIYERREDWGPAATVPERGLFLVAGADVQRDRVEVDVWAFGRAAESWLVEHVVLWGDTGEGAVWQALSELLGRTWEHATGARMTLQRLAIDTGGYTSEVYKWIRNQDRLLVMPVKGVGTFDRLQPVSGPTKIEIMPNGDRLKRGISLFTVSTSYFKREIYKDLRLPKPTTEQTAAGVGYPGGYIHVSTAASDEWCMQLVAEQQVVVRNRAGFAIRTEWRALRPRNEALDCCVYARAAAWLAGAERWSNAKWSELEAQLGLEVDDRPRLATKPPAAFRREAISEQPVAPPGAGPPAPATGPAMGGMIRRGGGAKRPARFRGM